MKKEIVVARKFIKPSFVYLIEKKRDGEEFTEDEVRYIVESILNEEIPQHQLTALLMAIYFQGMSAQETAVFAKEVMYLSDVLDLSAITKPKVDQYKTGGVGDKTAMILPPLAAACGVVVPSIHGLDEGFLISTVDKLSVIPGFNRERKLVDFKKQLAKVGCGIIEQNNSVPSIDAILYNLRQNTGTIPSLPLITGSILSRKLAAGAESLVIDVKWGNGSFMKDLEQAKQLARFIIRVSRFMKRRCVALVTDMNQPLGNAVGTALEIQEAIQLLSGEGPEDLQTLLLKLGMEVVRLAGVQGSTLSAQQAVIKQLQNGNALKKFKSMIEAQGGDISYIDDPEKLPKAKNTGKLPAQKRGYVHTIDAGMIARGVHILSGVGTPDFDPAAGVSEIKKIGTQVKQGEPLMLIHYNNRERLDTALDYFRHAYRLAPKRPNLPELIVERVA